MQAGSGTGTPGGVQEVQIITLPAGVIGGTWSINGGSALDDDAGAATVERYLSSLLSQTVYVSGSAGGPYTVTWGEIGKDLRSAGTKERHPDF